MKAVGASRNIEIGLMCNHVFIYQVCNENKVFIPNYVGGIYKVKCALKAVALAVKTGFYICRIAGLGREVDRHGWGES